LRLGGDVGLRWREAAFDPFVIDTIRNAEALFIAGGDQSRYVRFWKDNPVEDAINHVVAKPAPVGGTSAGMAILGEFSYSAMRDESLTAATALADPFHADLTFERDILALPGLGGIITDQHFQERDRIGRTGALMARLLRGGWTGEARAIAADRETSLHRPGDDVAVYRVGPGATFNIGQWSGTGGLAYSLRAKAGVLSSSRAALY
jgi:cyanophycinase-like exopeptidase